MAFDKKEKRTARSVINELVERTNSNVQRLRVLEQRTQSTASRVNTLEKDFLQFAKDLKRIVQDVDMRVGTEDEKIIKVENTIREVVAQIKRLATSADVRGLQELIDIYNPLKSNFMTKEQVEQLIEERLINK